MAKLCSAPVLLRAVYSGGGCVRPLGSLPRVTSGRRATACSGTGDVVTQALLPQHCVGAQERHWEAVWGHRSQNCCLKGCDKN